MTSLAELRQTLLTDTEVKTEYDRLGPTFAVVGAVADARQALGSNDEAASSPDQTGEHAR